MPATIRRRDPLPQTMVDIGEEWWDTIFDGRMWRIDGRVIPVPHRDNPEFSYKNKLFLTDDSCRRMRSAAVYRAKKRRLRCTGVIRHELLPNPDTGEMERVWCLFLQASSRDVRLKDVRWDRDQALPAPVMPVGLGRKRRGRGGPRMPVVQDMSEVIKRLLDAQAGPSATPASFGTHPELSWYAGRCKCGTLNMRTHDAHCPVYPLLEMLERVIKRQKMSPEAWAQLYGNRMLRI